MYLYFAHPIDQAMGLDPNHPLNRVIQDFTVQSSTQGHALFRPAFAHNLPYGPLNPDYATKIDDINRQAIWESDGVVAVLLPGVPTLGTPTEVENALNANRPVLILTTALCAASSVQITSWNRRGATVVHVGENGSVPEVNISECLALLPRPFELSTELATEVPKLLITGEAANCQQGKYQGDAGIDLAIAKDWVIDPGETVRLPTGVFAAVPDGMFAWMTGRSSTWSRFKLDVRTGIIDSGYRGELIVQATNHSDRVVKVEAGMRLAQLILLPTWGGQVEWVARLPEHERGENGWGSSGR